MTFEASAVDEEGKTVLGYYSHKSLQLRICYSLSTIYCEEVNQHIRVPLILPSHLPSSGSPEHWQAFLDCCFWQFVERKGLQVFPRLSGGGGGCCCKRANLTDSVHQIATTQVGPIHFHNDVEHDLASANEMVRELRKLNEDLVRRIKTPEEESNFQEELYIAKTRIKALEISEEEAIKTIQELRALKVEIKEAEVQVPSPRPKPRETIVFLAEEFVGTDFDALQKNSSDLQSRLICAWSMFKEAEKNGQESYAEKIMAWIHANGVDDQPYIYRQTKVKIAHLSMQVTVMRPLASTLKGMQNIRHVVLQHANIDAEATQILCAGLQYAIGLLTLDLQYNSIGTDGAIAIGERKMDWKNLTTLFLNDPTSAPIGPKGSKALFEIPPEDKAMWDRYAEKTYLNSLERVCLGGHQIKDEGVQYLVNALSYMKQLDTIYLYENGITDQGAHLLIEKINVAVSLTYIVTRGNSMSRDQEARLQQVLKDWVSSRQVKHTNPRPPPDYEPFILRNTVNQLPGVGPIIRPGDTSDEEEPVDYSDLINFYLPPNGTEHRRPEQLKIDFDAIKNNSSDLQSKLIIVWALLMEAHAAGYTSYEETINIWIRANSVDSQTTIWNQTRIVLINLTLEVSLMRTLTSVLIMMQKITIVELQYAGIDANATEILCAGLENAASLRTLDLQCNRIGTGGAIAIGKRKENWKNLTILFLNNPTSDPIGPKGVLALVQLPARHQGDNYPTSYLDSLETLCVSKHQIGDEGASYLAMAFKFMVKLKTLYIYEDQITDQGAIVIEEHIHFAKKLASLYTSGNLISSERQRRLETTLTEWIQRRNRTNMESRVNWDEDFSGFSFTDVSEHLERDFRTLQVSTSHLQSRLIIAVGMLMIAKGTGNASFALDLDTWISAHDYSCSEDLLKQTQIMLIQLRLTGRLMRPLAFAFTHMQSLTSVILQHAHIDAKATEILCEGLKHAVYLHTLDLQYNSIGWGGAVAIGQMKTIWIHLSVLLLNNPTSHPFRSDGVKALFELPPDEYEDLWKKYAPRKSYLDSLYNVHLDGQMIEDSGVDWLVRAFAIMINLVEIHITHNDITEAGALLLLQNLHLLRRLRNLSVHGNHLSSDMENNIAKEVYSRVQSVQVEESPKLELQGTIEELQRQLKGVKEQYQTVIAKESSNVALQKKYSDLENSKKRELLQQADTLAKTQKELKEAQIKLGIRDQRISELEKRISELEKELTNAKSNIRERDTRLATLDRDILRLNQEKTDLFSQVSIKENEIKALNNQIANMKPEGSAREDQVSLINIQIAEPTHRLSTTEDKSAGLRRETETKDSRITELTHELKTKEEYIAELKREIVELKTRFSQRDSRELPDSRMEGDVQKLIAVLEDEVMCFNAATSQWKQLLALRQNIKVDATTSSTFISPNRIVTCGGGYRDACTRHVGNTAYMLEGDGSVQELPHMSTGRSWPGLAWDSVRQALYVFGGLNGERTCYIVYLRTSEKFKSKWSPLPDMHQYRCKFNPCWYLPILYLCGGERTTSVETYDPRSNTFALQDFTLPEHGSTTAVVKDGTLTVISNYYISKLQQGRLISQKHGEYLPWSNCTPLVSRGEVYVISFNNCCRCIDLNIGVVLNEVSLS